MLTRTTSGRTAAETAPDTAPALDLNLLMLFRDIMSAGSINQAALQLHVPKATLSRKLRQLEEHFGAVLVKRGSHKIEPTLIGTALLHRCDRIAAETFDASLVASEMQSQVRGVLRISMPFGLQGTWISRALAEFALQYPELRQSIHVTNRWIDVSEEPFDLALCIGNIRNQQLPVRQLAELPRGLYASPAYCTRRGVPKTPADLRHHNCIMLDSQQDEGLWSFMDSGAGVSTPHLITTDIAVAREMAVAGVGIVMLAHVACEAEVRNGQLVPLLPEVSLPPALVTAVFLERRHMPLRIRTFIDFLVHASRDQAPPSGSTPPN